jgi:serine phosphatase RsbU (regulator of sigma subunit)
VTSLPAVPDEAFDRFAQLVRTVLGVPVALVSLVDRDGQVFPGAAGLGEPWITARATPLSHSFCQHVVIDAAPLVIADARCDPRLRSNEAITDLGVIAYAGMPLIDGAGAVAGSLCAIDVEPREWTASELSLLSDLAAACSAELQLRGAARRVEASLDRTRLLLELSEALSAPVTVADISHTVAAVAGSRFGADYGGIALLDEAGRNLSYVDAAALPDEVAVFGVDDDMPGAVAARTRIPQFFDTIDELVSVLPDAESPARRTGGQTFAHLPLQVGRRVLGTLGLFWREPYRLDPLDREVLAGLARYTAQAVERAQLLEERRDVARTLQEALLPILPEVAGLQLGGRYLPAHVTDQIGGDWYDAFRAAPDPDPDAPQTLTFVIGDVSGHDTAASAAMGQLRATLRALAVDRPDDPSGVLSRLDHVMTVNAGDRLATAVVATVTRGADGSSDLAWSNAGHLPPLLLEPGQPATYLERPVDRLLGFSADCLRRTHHYRLTPGSTLLLFTDGLIERRGIGLDEGLAALAYAAEGHREASLDDLLDGVLQAAMAGGRDDDTAIFGVRIGGW